MRISDWSSDVCSSDLGRLHRERQHAARQEVLASDLHDAGTDPVPLLQRLRGAALGYSKRLAAPDQVAHEDAAAGLGLADLLEADHCRSKGTQADLGRAALVPAPAPNIVVDDVPAGLDAARPAILERGAPKHAGTLTPNKVRQHTPPQV